MDNKLKTKITIQEVLDIVGAYYKVSAKTIASKVVKTSKYSGLPKARAAAMNIFVSVMGMSQSMAANVVGRTRDMASRAMKFEVPSKILEEISNKTVDKCDSVGNSGDVSKTQEENN